MANSDSEILHIVSNNRVNMCASLTLNKVKKLKLYLNKVSKAAQFKKIEKRQNLFLYQMIII